MDEDEDDLYSSQGGDEVLPAQEVSLAEPSAMPEAAMKNEEEDDDDDVDEDEDDDDSDIEIVTEAKPSDRKEPLTQSRRSEIKIEKPAAGVRTETPVNSARAPPSPSSREPATTRPPSAPQRSGADYPAIHSSTIDVDAEPVLDVSGKPLLKTDMDADFGENDKPWRLPGADQTDYFNYGFDEFTWSSYCLKQENLRKEAQEQEKQLDDMQKFFSMPGMGSAGAPGGGTSGGDSFQPDMMAMMQQMMTAGMDPSSQMDVNNFMQMGGGGGGGGGGMGGGNYGGGGGGYGGGHGGNHVGGGGGRRHGRGRY